MFKTPFEGIYQFYFATTSADTNYTSRATLFVNGNPIIGAQDITASYPTTGDNTAILNIQKGDTVYTQLRANDRSGSGRNGYNTYSSFSGVFVGKYHLLIILLYKSNNFISYKKSLWNDRETK